MQLMKKKNEFWYEIPEKSGYADESVILEPDNELTQNEESDNWKEAATGIFRMYKKYSTHTKRPSGETEKFIIPNEFEVKKRCISGI